MQYSVTKPYPDSHCHQQDSLVLGIAVGTKLLLCCKKVQNYTWAHPNLQTGQCTTLNSQKYDQMASQCQQCIQCCKRHAHTMEWLLHEDNTTIYFTFLHRATSSSSASFGSMSSTNRTLIFVDKNVIARSRICSSPCRICEKMPVSDPK